MAERGNHEILLETGTNEIEIMEFTIDGNLYGINVAKVREILMSAPVHPMPHSHPAVEGIFKPRDIVITVVDLPKYLSGREEEKGNKDLFIITNFNQMHIAFRVHTVVGISRISWQDIQKPDKTVSGGPEGVATGIAQCGEELVTILDFEKIVAEIAPETGIQLSEVDRLGPRSRNETPIWVAEDSILLTQMIRSALVGRPPAVEGSAGSARTCGADHHGLGDAADGWTPPDKADQMRSGVQPYPGGDLLLPDHGGDAPEGKRGGRG